MSHAVENKVTSRQGVHMYTLEVDDVRIALFFLFFVQIAFFGTGKYVTRVGSIRTVSINSRFIAMAVLHQFRTSSINGNFQATSNPIFQVVLPRTRISSRPDL
jgi:hypothetical protein